MYAVGFYYAASLKVVCCNTIVLTSCMNANFMGSRSTIRMTELVIVKNGDIIHSSMKYGEILRKKFGGVQQRENSREPRVKNH